MENFVIFTDLDGTLLDESSYSCTQAQAALDMIAAGEMPLVFCSSKTRAELEAFRMRQHNAHPFVSENGGGIFIPHGYFAFPFEAQESYGYQLIELGLPYAAIRKKFSFLRAQTGAKVRGFSDMSVAEVASLTGLSEKEAALARQRDFDEAFVFEGEVDENFLRAIEAAGLHWTQGRIFHIMGNHDKGRAVKVLLALYQRKYGAIRSIGLGDSLNDLPMLQAVDHPVLVKHKDGIHDARITMPHLVKTRLPGPAGWSESMLQLLRHEAAGNGPGIPPREILHRQQLLDIFNASLSAADPYAAVLREAKLEHLKLHISGTTYSLEAFERIIVIGAGKAAARMALAVESLLDGKIDAGLIVVKDGYTEHLSIIGQVESPHPVPGEAGVAATRRILEMARAADEKTLLICLLSGGASALLLAPGEGLSLQDKQEVTGLLLNAGASINELNAVRKHLSSVKGGRLAQVAYPARLITLILSDVIGDPLDVIASGPTAADSSTFAEAWGVILKYALAERISPRVVDYLLRGIAGQVAETVKGNASCLATVQNVLVASNKQALLAAREKSAALGFAVKVLNDRLQGEARDAAHFIAQAARDELALMKPGERRCLLCGGETTVTVRGNGKGGRNQELALAFALETEGLQGVSLLSAGTDGTDGPNDAAGALVDGNTVAMARSMGIDAAAYLDNNDSYHFFQHFDTATGMHSHLITGPTGTNVMDVQIVLLNK